MITLSDQDLDTALRNADAAGDVAAATAFAKERRKRRESPVNASVAASMRVPEPQGFLEESGINAFGRAVRENVGGAAGAAAGSAAGLKGGMALGNLLPLPPGIGAAVGGGVGAIGGGFAGAMFGGQAQQAVYPTSEDTKRILEADAVKSPVMSTAGNILPYLATLKISPGNLGTAFTKITPQMTAAETSAIVGNRVGTALGAGLGGISEVAVPMIRGQEVSPERVLLGAALGGLFTEPNRIGRAIGFPSSPTLRQVQAGQMAAAIPTPDAPPQFPAIDTPTPLALPESSQNGVQASMRREQAIEIQQQIERLTARRDDMVKRGVDPRAIKQINQQLAARETAMRGLEFDTTIIAPSAPQSPRVIVERNAMAAPPQAVPVAPGVAVNAETGMVPRSPEINVDQIIGPRALGFPEAGVVPVDDISMSFRPPIAIDTPAPLALPAAREASAPPALPESSPNSIRARMGQEQAVEMQQQIERLQARRDGMVARKADPKAIKQIEKQLKAREQAMMRLEFDSTIIAPPVEQAPRSIVERNAMATPPQSRQIVPEIVPTPVPVPEPVRQVPPAEASANVIAASMAADDRLRQSPMGASALREQMAAAPQERPVDPRMAARASGEDVIARGDRPAFMSADAIQQAKLEQESVSQSPVGAAGLREQLSAQSEKVNTIPEDLARARANMAKGGKEAERVRASTEPVAAFRQANGELKMYDGHHRLVNALDSGAETLPVKIDGEGVKNIPVSAFVETPPKAELVPAPTEVQSQLITPKGEVPTTATEGQPMPGGSSKSAVVPAEAPAAKPTEAVAPTAKAPAVTPEPTPAAVETPEVVSLRNQLEKLDEDIFNAKEDGDEYGAKGLEIARRRVQGSLNEALNPQTPKSVADKIRAKKVKPGSKGQISLPLFGLDDATMRRAWNGALEVAARAYEAGASLAKAAQAGIAYIRQNFPKATFKDADVAKAVEADITEGMPSARRAGDKEAAQTAASEMDRNPDKFFTDNGSTPVQTYMDDVDRTMKNLGRDVIGGRAAKGVWQRIKDVNRNILRGNQAALDDLAKGGGGTGRASPALEKLNTAINGTRPGAQGKGERGIWDNTITRLRARTNELSSAYDGISPILNNLGTVEQEALLANLVKWMKDSSSTAKLKNQPTILNAVETLRKVTKDLYNDLKANGIDVGDAGPNYFQRTLDVDMVRRNYDEFVDKFTKFYDEQWKQNDPNYVSDMAKARDAAKAYADAAILGHEGIALDGSDLNLGVARSGDPDFFKARTFTGAVSDSIDQTAAKFYQRNPFQTLAQQINRVERRIGLVRAFGKIVKENGKDVLDPTAKWREFVDAAVKEGNEGIVKEVRERYQMMFGIGGKFDPSTQAFQRAVRNLGYYSYLPFSGINSLTEPTVIAMRLNKPVSGLFQSYGKAFRSMARQIKNMPLDYKEKLADRLGLAENATMRMATHLGKIDEQGVISGKGVSKFMFLTGNSIVSNATSNASVDIGMTALRTSLLDFEYGRDANSARMWLEELGVKKADFDRVSKWLEGQANDEARFNNVMEKSPEAEIVRDALRKFAREARSLPDAGTKNQYASGPIGSMLLSLQSYLYDFTDKVLGRNWRQLKTGLAGKTTFDGDVDPTQLAPQERVRLMAPMMLGMPSLIAVNYGLALMRETMYPDPEKIRRDRERTAGEINWNRFQRALTRSNTLGPYDMLYNMFTQARYEKDVAATALGPYMGGVLELAKSAIALNEGRNSANTNTAERKAARDFWNVGPKPLINMALSSLPGGKLAPVAAAGIQFGSQRSVAEGFVDTLAGPQKTERKKPKRSP